MRPRVLVAGQDVSHLAQVAGFEVARASGESISTASVEFVQELEGARFPVQGWSEWSTLEIRNWDDAADVRFRGYVTSMEPEAFSNLRYRLKLTAADAGLLLDRKVITQTWTDATDREIVQDLAAAAASLGITAPIGTVAFTSAFATWEVKDATVREGLDQLCELTGNRWHVDYQGRLHYYYPGTRFAPFSLSDVGPFDAQTEPFKMLEFRREFALAANRITVLGAIGEGGAELRVTREDASSIAEYGVLEAVSVAREMASAAMATIAADSELAERAHPQISGRALVLRGGLEVGQTIGVQSALYGVDANLIITGIRERYAGTEIAYEIEFGQRQADIVTAFRRLSQVDRAVPVAVPAPGSIDDDAITGMHASKLIGLIAAEQVGGQFTAEQIGTISAVNVAGAFNAGSVTLHAQDVTGVFISDQLADNILDSLRLVGREMQLVERLGGSVNLPALPNADYPDGSLVLKNAVYGRTKYGQARYGSTLWENKAGTWTRTTAGASLTGMLRARDIQEVSAESIVGLIIADKIENVRMNQLIGQLQANQIYQVSAESITSMNADTITLVGRWKDGQIESVSASKLTAGTITATVRMTSPEIDVDSDTGVRVEINTAVGIRMSNDHSVMTIEGGMLTIKDVQLPDRLATLGQSSMSFGRNALQQLAQLTVFSGHPVLRLVGASNSSWTMEARTDGEGNALVGKGTDPSIELLGSSSWIYASKYRTVVTTVAATAMPATYTKYINIYNFAGTLQGRIPII